MKKKLILILLAALMLSGCDKKVVAHTLRSDIEYVPPVTEDTTVTEATTEDTTVTEEATVSSEETEETTTVTVETTTLPETQLSAEETSAESFTEETTEPPVIVTADTTASATVLQETTVSENTTVTSATTVETTTVSETAATTTTTTTTSATTTTTAATTTTTSATTTTTAATTTTTSATTTTTAVTTTTTSATTTTTAAITTTTAATTTETEYEEEYEEEEEEWEPEYDYSPVEVATEALKHNATADSFIKSVNSFLTKAKSGGYGMINGEEGSLICFYIEDGLWTVMVDNTDCFNYKEEVMEWNGYGAANKNTSKADAEDPDTLFAIHMANEFPNIYNASAGVWVEDGKCKAAYFTDDTTSGDSQIECILGVGGWTELYCEWDGYNQGMSDEGNVVGTSPVLKFKASE